MIENKLDLEWVCDTRVDLVNDELLSFNEHRRMQNHLVWSRIRFTKRFWRTHRQKHQPWNKWKTLLNSARKDGHKNRLLIHAWLARRNNRRHGMASHKFAKKLNPDWCQFNIFIAYPDSKLYQEMLETGKYTELDDFLLSVKTDEFDYNALMAVQRQFFKDFHMRQNA